RPETVAGRSSPRLRTARLVACRSCLPSLELAKFAQSAGPVFREDMTRAWRPAMRRACIVDFRFHDLRHSAASYLLQPGANLAEVAQLLGHKDIRMTQRYSHVHNEYTLALIDRVMGGTARVL